MKVGNAGATGPGSIHPSANYNAATATVDITVTPANQATLTAVAPATSATHHMKRTGEGQYGDNSCDQEGRPSAAGCEHTGGCADDSTSEHLAEVERKIEELSRLRDALREMANCCGQTVAECRIIDALASKPG